MKRALSILLMSLVVVQSAWAGAMAACCIDIAAPSQLIADDRGHAHYPGDNHAAGDHHDLHAKHDAHAAHGHGSETACDCIDCFPGLTPALLTSLQLRFQEATDRYALSSLGSWQSAVPNQPTEPPAA